MKAEVPIEDFSSILPTNVIPTTELVISKVIEYYSPYVQDLNWGLNNVELKVKFHKASGIYVSTYKFIIEATKKFRENQEAIDFINALEPSIDISTENRSFVSKGTANGIIDNYVTYQVKATLKTVAMFT